MLASDLGVGAEGSKAGPTEEPPQMIARQDEVVFLGLSANALILSAVSIAAFGIIMANNLGRQQ
jgi:hypothetical protein